MGLFFRFICLAFCFSLSSCLRVDNSFENDEVAYQPATSASSNLDSVRRVLSNYGCATCHGPAGISSTKFLVDSWGDAQWKIDLVVPGKPLESKLFKSLRRTDCVSGDSCWMPDGSTKTFTAEDTAIIRKWIEELQ